MNKTVTNRKTLIRILALFGFLFSVIATTNNFVQGIDHEPFTKSFLYPYTNYFVPFVNIFCGIMALIVLIFPMLNWIIIFVLFLSATHLIFTGFYIIGIWLYINGLVFLVCFGYFQKHFLRKAILSQIYIFLILLTLIKNEGLSEFLFILVMTAFFEASYVVIYKTLSDKLNFLLGDYNFSEIKPMINLPEKGEVLELKKLGLTERQIACINYTINTTYNYKQIAEELITSESTVKKNMQDLYKIFGVKNREMLRLLLIQYTIL